MDEINTNKMREFFDKILALKTPDFNEGGRVESENNSTHKNIDAKCTNLPFLCTLCEEKTTNYGEIAKSNFEKSNVHEYMNRIEKGDNEEINSQKLFNGDIKIEITNNDKSIKKDKNDLNHEINCIVDKNGNEKERKMFLNSSKDSNLTNDINLNGNYNNN